MKEFEGRTAILTGGASGMSLLTAQKLAEAGANVVLSDINEQAAQEKADEIVKNGGSASAFKTDIRDWRQVLACAEFTEKKYGKIDFLLNAAGGFSGRVLQDYSDFAERKFETLEWGIDVNLRGAMFFTRAVMPSMVKNKFGVIINMGSVDGVTGAAQAIDYSAAKSGMIGMTKGIALYGAKKGIRSVCISPGPVLTRPAMAGMPTPMGRAAEVIEVVNLILYMFSDKAAYISGTNISIDGVRSCGGNEK